MKRFIQGEHRGHGTFLPESLDDYVTDTNLWVESGLCSQLAEGVRQSLYSLAKVTSGAVNS